MDSKISSLDYLKCFFSKRLLLFVAIVFYSYAAFAGSQVTYHGRILKADDTPISGSTEFILEVRSTGSENCLLYSETQTKSVTDGVFSVTLNDGTGTRTDTTGYSFESVFSNRSAYSLPTQCAASFTGWTPTATSGRKLAVSFKDPSMGSHEALPVQALNLVPQAIEAQYVGGYGSGDLLKINNSGSVHLTQSNLEGAFTGTSYTNLQAILAGNFVGQTTGAGAALPSVTVNPSSPAVGSIWFNSTDGTLKYYDGAVRTITNASYSISGVTSTADVTLNGSASGSVSSGAVAIGLANTGVSAGSYAKVTVDVKGRVTAGTTLVEADIPVLSTPGKVSGSAIDSGTIGGSASINITGAIASSSSVTAAGMSTRTFDLYDSDNTNRIRFLTPATGVFTTDYQLVFPATAGTSGYVLSTDGSGNLSWVNGASGGVTTVGAFSGTSTANGLSVSGTSIFMHAADGTNPGAVSTSAQTFAGVKTFSSDVVVADQKTIQFYEASGGGSDYVGLRAPAALAAPYTLILPTSDGSANQVLKTDGSGNLGWSSVMAAVAPSTAGNILLSDGSSWVSAAAPIATTATVGVMRVGTGLTVTVSGVVAADFGAAAGKVTEGNDKRLAPAPIVADALKVVRQNSLGDGYEVITAAALMGSANVYVQDGNSFGAAATLGTNDGYPLRLETSGTARMTIDTTGNVGIGTTAPTESLEISSASPVLILSSAASAATDYFRISNGDIKMARGTGNVTMDISPVVSDGSSIGHVRLFRNTTTTGVKSFSILKGDGTSTVDSRIAVGGDSYLNVSSGNVGIGTTNPGAKLHVMEELRIGGSTSGYVGLKAPAVAGSGVLTLPATVGTSGQTLVTDGSGVLSWTAGGASGVFPIALGSAGTPSMNFSGDTDTGFFSPGADTVAISTSGVERLRVNASGYIGIGTTAPAVLLHVSNQGGTSGTPVSNGLISRLNNGAFTDTNTAASGTANAAVFNFISQPSLTASNSSVTTTFSETFRINSAPTAELNQTITNSVGLRIATNPVNGSGSVTNSFGLYVAAPSGAANNYAAVFTGGNVGIGTTAPGARLDIAGGDLRLSGATSGYVGLRAPAVAGSGILTLPATVGTSGQTLVTDGSGVLTWMNGGAAGVFPIALGSAGTPSMNFSGDTDTGFFSPGADSVAIATSGTERLRVSTSGNVGIGNVIPRYLLHAGDATTALTAYTGNGINTFTPQIVAQPSSGVAGLGAFVNNGTNNRRAAIFMNDTDTLWGLSQANTSGGAVPFVIRQYSIGEVFRIDASGYIGIGLTSPSSLFHARGTNATTYTSSSSATDTPINLSSSVSPAFQLDNTSNTDGSGAYLGFLVKASSANGQRAYIGAVSNSSPRTPDIVFGQGTGLTAYSERMRINSSGNVGIGTTSPSAKLHVMDEMRIGGSTSGYVGLKAPAAAGSTTYTLPSADGSANQVLSTNGSGVLSWTAGGAAGVFPIALGTVGTPSMNFSGDTDTGIYSPGADVVAISTSGVERLRVNSSGNVGIGTTSPTQPLDVVGNVKVGGMLTVYSSTAAVLGDSGSNYVLRRNVDDNRLILTGGNAAASGGGISLFGGTHSVTPNMITFSNSSNEAMRINGSGNVGIGTTAPSYIMQVEKSSTAAYVAASGISVPFNAADPVIYVRNASSTDGSAAYLAMNASDSAGRDNVAYIGAVSTAGSYSPTMIFGARSSNSSYNERMRLDSNGNLGIGTTSPGAKLNIAGGDLRISGSTSGYVGLRAPAVAGSGILTLPATVGTSGQTLVTDGSGILSWANAGAAGVFPIALGTSAAPSMNFTGDTDTGIYSPGADTVAISTSGLERIRVSSAGYLGVGTTSPDRTLHVAAATSAPQVHIARTDASPMNLWIGGYNQYAGFATDRPFEFRVSSTNGSDGTSAMFINSSGNVGIGTTNPTSQFHMSGAYTSSSGTYSQQTTTLDATASSNAAFVGHTANVSLVSGSTGAGTTGFQANVSNTGAGANSNPVGFGALITNSGAGSIASAKGVYIKTQNTGAGSFSASYGLYVDTLAGASKWSIYSNDSTAPSYFAGNVGIGTTNPGAKLHVMEEVRIGGSTSGYVGLKAPAVAGSGILTLPATVGTSGQTLVTDGSGVLSWAAGGAAGVFPIALGTSAAPSMNFTGDTNTGIYSPAADNVAISTSGVERLRVTDTGAVGIGTTNPSANLHVSNNSGAKIFVGANGVPSSTYTADSSTLALPTGHAILNLANYGNLDDQFIGITMIADNAADTGQGAYLGALTTASSSRAPIVFGQRASSTSFIERMRLDGSGNLGIGTTAPGARLDIAGGDLRLSGATSGYVGLRAPAVAGSGILTLPSSVGTSGQTLVTDGSGVLTWMNGGAAGVFPIALGSAGTPSMNFTGDTDTGIYSPGADTVAISTSAAERIRISSTGYVGIGTTAPSQLLEVSGSGVPQFRITDTDASGSGIVIGDAGGGASVFWPMFRGFPIGSNRNTWMLSELVSTDDTGTHPAMLFTSRVISPAAAVITTRPLFEWRNNTTPQMTMLASGNLGIGTTSPGAKLEVVGGAVRSSRVAAQYVELYGGDSGSFTNTYVRSQQSEGNKKPLIISTLHDSTGAAGGTHYISFETGAASAPTEHMRINSSGNVGIGTTSPTRQLDIASADTSTTSMGIANSSAGGRTYTLGSTGSGNAIGAGNFYIYDASAASFRMVMNSSGSVGIGTTSPSAPSVANGIANLDVIGSIRAFRQFQVDSKGSFPQSPKIQYTYNGAEYARIQAEMFNTNNTELGFWTNNAGTLTESVRITFSGNVGIGTTTPGEKLEVSGNAKATAFISTSDKRLKRDIQPAPGLSAINQLNGVTYNWIKDGQADMGVLAQDVEKVLPQVVSTDPNTGYKAVKYNALIAPLIESVKALYKRLIGVERDVASLKEKDTEKDKRIQKLEEENAQLKAYLCTKDPKAPICKK